MPEPDADLHDDPDPDLGVPGPGDTPRPVVVAREATPRGELVLRRHGHHHEIISNGMFLMDTRDGGSERLLVEAALAATPGARSVLLAGLGVGHSLLAALADPRVGGVTVVEREPAVVAWHDTHLAPVTGGALRDPRVSVVVADFPAWLGTVDERFDVIAVDIDNGPDWTVTPGNAELYTDRGLAGLRARLADDGTLAVWSASAAEAFARLLGDHFVHVWVETHEVARGEPDHVHLARTPRTPGPGGGTAGPPR